MAVLRTLFAAVWAASCSIFTRAALRAYAFFSECWAARGQPMAGHGQFSAMAGHDHPCVSHTTLDKINLTAAGHGRPPTDLQDIAE